MKSKSSPEGNETSESNNLNLTLWSWENNDFKFPTKRFSTHVLKCPLLYTVLQNFGLIRTVMLKIMGTRATLSNITLRVQKLFSRYLRHLKA